MTRPSLSSTAHAPRRWLPIQAPPCLTGYPLLLLRPPYEAWDLRTTLPDIRAAAQAPGTVVGVQLHRPDPDPGALQALVGDLSRQAPSCPVVVLLQLPPQDALLALTRLAPLQLRAVVPHGPMMLPILRGALTDRTTLPRSVVEWLRLHLLRLNPQVEHLLECFFRDATEHADLTGFLEAHCIPQSTARSRLRKKCLPSPSQWFQLARATHAALRIQADPDAATSAVAHRMGFADHSALAHLLRRSLGVRARDVRGTLGWEWLLHRWLVRHGVRVR